MSNVIDLCGPWEIRPDPDDRGVRERWFERSPADGWREITVPSAWQHTLGTDFHGVAWYRRRVEVPSEWLREGSRIWLAFESVATDCRVWVNGRGVGRHVGDYLPFRFELTASIAVTADAAPPVIEIVARVDEVPATRPPPGVTTENGHITKGFHDVLSLQHGGIWGGMALRRTGARAFLLDGVSVAADPSTGRVRVKVRADGDLRDLQVHTVLTDPDGDVRYSSSTRCVGDRPITEFEKTLIPRMDGEPGWILEQLSTAMGTHRVGRDSLPPTEPWWPAWSPQSPRLFTLSCDISTLHDSDELDSHEVRFGMRSLTTGGAGNRTILLNGEPIQIRGVLHWGHEPRHIAPAPPPEQVRAEFAHLKEMGFNCVCLCMWYAPEYYYDIADEMGMLIWQEHPVWKSRMEGELIPEYKRLFEGFFRRDRRHASVVIISGSCEHERIHPDLAAWWWHRAKQELPDRLVQVQTAFTSWVNPGQTDLHDEHVYESSGRWVKFLEDMQAALAELPPKPFVMGETIIATAWGGNEQQPPSGAGASGPHPPQAARGTLDAIRWWAPKGVQECEAFEGRIIDRYGPAALDRFKRHAARNNLLHRKFQSEVFRSYPSHGGWVMNQIRDVPVGRLGFMDERDRWRFTADQTLPWLCDCPVLLRPPDWRWGFSGGRMIECGIGVANFGAAPFDGRIDFRIEGADPGQPVRSAHLRCARGEVNFVPARIELPAVTGPTRLGVRADASGLVSNSWDLWVFPEPGDVPDGVVRLEGLPFDARDLEQDFEERAYSSGWGLKVRTWKPQLPNAEKLLFRCPLWRFDAPMPPGTRVVVTHKLTAGLLDWMQAGGRVLWLAAGRSRGSLATRFVTLWGQCPLVPEEGPLGSGDSEWVADLLHHDLTRRYTRAVPVEEMRRAGPSGAGTVSIVDQVEPIVRYVFTHDRGVPRFLDAAFAARVGRGLLIGTSLDHSEDAGQYLLRRLIDFGLAARPACRAELDPVMLRDLAVP